MLRTWPNLKTAKYWCNLKRLANHAWKRVQTSNNIYDTIRVMLFKATPIWNHFYTGNPLIDNVKNSRRIGRSSVSWMTSLNIVPTENSTTAVSCSWLQDAGVTQNEKCKFSKHKMTLLSDIISENGIEEEYPGQYKNYIKSSLEGLKNRARRCVMGWKCKIDIWKSMSIS